MADNYTVKNYSVAQIAYLAGIIDGEGCVYIGNHSCNKETGAKYYQTLIKISSTDICLIDWLTTIFGGLRGEYTPTQMSKNGRKQVYFWQCSGNRLTHLCQLILPFVIIKKAEIEIMLKMRATFNGVAQKGKQGIQAHSEELLDLRQSYLNQLRALHIRNHTYNRD